ncbi:class A beta-lactamase-related serine hydrolase [Nocardia yunnanensis]|uniref:Class A beta-lactamase-related serine hydrolase n=1 Tax=Nocardia yunnanensis TaxID=2382165 RepID=A0A386Z4K6_9NOCA|nr:serine hydrolase domain-containing protein [Nocardia yunnanensis]AYF72581.1 class A beta-lactamase-related serine hydrolase [Nocardia yunnanensis]
MDIAARDDAVAGFCAPEFASLRAAFVEQVVSGAELGASVCVTVDGETVVDLWGGYADPERTRPWDVDTLVNTFSITKTMVALSALLLVDRGELDVYQKVAHYWPEFAANGKADIEVRHLLSHTSGVSGWEAPIVLPDIYDPDAAADRLAAQPPWWEPGTASGYHAMNYGHLIGAVIERITGRPLGRFFAEELAEPLGADFHIGTPAADLGRIATLVPPELPEFDPSLLPQDSVMFKTLFQPLLDFAECGTPQWQQAELGGMGGHGNARSIARLQSLVSNGGALDGRKFLSDKTIELIFEPQSDGVDLALMLPLRFGIGYGLPQAQAAPHVPDGKVCWWAGLGGAFVVNDLDHRVTFAYAMNRMAPGLIGSDRADAYLKATFDTVRGRA